MWARLSPIGALLAFMAATAGAWHFLPLTHRPPAHAPPPHALRSPPPAHMIAVVTAAGGREGFDKGGAQREGEYAAGLAYWAQRFPSRAYVVASEVGGGRARWPLLHALQPPLAGVWYAPRAYPEAGYPASRMPSDKGSKEVLALRSVLRRLVAVARDAANATGREAVIVKASGRYEVVDDGFLAQLGAAPPDSWDLAVRTFGGWTVDAAGGGRLRLRVKPGSALAFTFLFAARWSVFKAFYGARGGASVARMEAGMDVERLLLEWARARKLRVLELPRLGVRVRWIETGERLEF